MVVVGGTYVVAGVGVGAAAAELGAGVLLGYAPAVCTRRTRVSAGQSGMGFHAREESAYFWWWR